MAKAISKKISVTHPVNGTIRKFDADIYEPVKAGHFAKPEGK